MQRFFEENKEIRAVHIDKIYTYERKEWNSFSEEPIYRSKDAYEYGEGLGELNPRMNEIPLNL